MPQTEHICLRQVPLRQAEGYLSFFLISKTMQPMIYPIMPPPIPNAPIFNPTTSLRSHPITNPMIPTAKHNFQQKFSSVVSISSTSSIRESIVTSNHAAIAFRLLISGIPFPISHFVTACLDTFNNAASCSWEYSFWSLSCFSFSANIMRPPPASILSPRYPVVCYFNGDCPLRFVSSIQIPIRSAASSPPNTPYGVWLLC